MMMPCRLLQRSLLVSTLLLMPVATARLAAQDTTPDSGKVLSIIREVLKPGKDGPPHEKTEAAYVRAMKASKSDDYYLAFTALTGPPRVLFISAYSSFADLEAKRKEVTPATQAALDAANTPDGELLTETTTGAFVRRDDLSTNVKAMPAGAHLLQILQIIVKPGTEQEFEQSAKLYMADYTKAVPDAHWTCYQLYFGSAVGSEYIFMTAMKSMAEADKELAGDMNFGKSTSPADLKKMDAGLAASAVSMMTNVFMISKKMSYPDPKMVAADPKYWAPEPAAKAPVKKTP
jgi:hypothetical protein